MSNFKSSVVEPMQVKPKKEGSASVRNKAGNSINNFQKQNRKH